jgi:hypothetical protein
MAGGYYLALGNTDCANDPYRSVAAGRLMRRSGPEWIGLFFQKSEFYHGFTLASME